MSIEIIREREWKTEVYYEYEYPFADGCGRWFSFPCDKDGNINEVELSDCAKENLRKCRAKEYDVLDSGVHEHEREWKEPAIGRCDCGHEIYLESFTNTCEKCGADYNMSGQHLAPRSQWGEETGETADEILNIGHTIS